ncbi:MAG: hypothetical protein GY940_19860 [bacterium]|nr:hypothetical protein [bacterium]
MPKNFDIKVENKLTADKRGINIYHYATKDAYLISHNSSITLPLRGIEEEDYLHISIVRGPGHLWKHCWVHLPSWADFEFSSEGTVTLTHYNDRTLLKIPPGPPTWQLKMTRPSGSRSVRIHDNIIIKDGEPDGG